MGRFPIGSLVAGAMLAACSGGGQAPVTDGCHIGALGVCSSYPGGAPPGFALGCSIDGGTLVTACQVEGRLGTCVFTVHAGAGGAPVTASTTWYPGVLATPVEVADACADLGGEFTAGTAQAGAATEQTFSCDARSVDGTCSDYSGLWEPERRAAFEWRCTTWDGGTLLPPGTACSTDGRTGTCRTTLGSATRVEEVRYYDPATAAADEAACPYGWISG
jgi:hypothetical protein